MLDGILLSTSDQRHVVQRLVGLISQGDQEMLQRVGSLSLKDGKK